MVAAIAPGEWLLFSDDADAGKTIRRIETAMSGNTALITDVTAGVVALRLGGTPATACLAAYTALNLGDCAMPTGTAIRTRFGDIGVFLARTANKPEYLLIADQSYTPYLRALVTHGPPHR